MPGANGWCAILDSAHDLPDQALLFINLAPATLGHELSAAAPLAPPRTAASM